MIKNYTGVSGSRIAWLVAQEQSNKMLAVVSTGRTAERLAQDLSFCAPDARIFILPEEADAQILYEARSREAQVQRIRGIHALCSGTPASTTSSASASTKAASADAGTTNTAAGTTSSTDSNSTTPRTFVIAPVTAVAKLTESPERYMAGITRIALGDVMEPSDLREKLVSLGYTSAAVTESPGEFTSRGGILDVFPPALEHPLRIEFFGDEVDSIRFFDQDTQRSLENTQSAEIGPAAEFLPTDEEKKAALRKIRREYDRRITEIKSRYLKDRKSVV